VITAYLSAMWPYDCTFLVWCKLRHILAYFSSYEYIDTLVAVRYFSLSTQFWG
jgi:hypothetical protein